MRPDGPRDPVAGPDSGPEDPFPIRLYGPVIKGFGRGSKDLGIPTANIPPDQLSRYPDLPTGVYYGFVCLQLPATITTAAPKPTSSPSSPPIYTSVLSIGYNPFYANKTRSIEIHIMEPPIGSSPSPASGPNSSNSPPNPASSTTLPETFYDSPLNLLLLGYIRPEYDYVSKESLIVDIHTDIAVARRSLDREAYRRFAVGDGTGEGEGEDGRWLKGFAWVEEGIIGDASGEPSTA